jgi:beta-glucosidase
LTAAALIGAVQESGIASAIKHFVANDMEHERTSVNCIISGRALREVYLLPFQLALRTAKPWALMTAYNKVNGTHVSEHAGILQDIVKKEWEYDGCIISDWYGTYSTAQSINAGLDIEMPGPSAWRGKNVAKAVSVGKIKESTIDDRVSAVLRLTERCATSNIPPMGPEICLDTPEDRDLLRTLAAESIVLLKNENALLPLRPDKKVRESLLLPCLQA